MTRLGAHGGSWEGAAGIVPGSASLSRRRRANPPSAAPSLSCGCDVEAGVFCRIGRRLLYQMVVRYELVDAGFPRFVLRGAVRRLVRHLKVDPTPCIRVKTFGGTSRLHQDPGVGSRSYRRIP